MTFTGSFPFFKALFCPWHKSVQCQFNRAVLCFLLLLSHCIVLSFKGEVGASRADVQHLQVGQMCEGALVHGVHGEPVKTEKNKQKRGRFVMTRGGGLAEVNRQQVRFTNHICQEDQASGIRTQGSICWALNGAHASGTSRSNLVTGVSLTHLKIYSTYS